MPPYDDLYVLARERSETVATSFLDAFAPDREQSAEEYEFPEYAEQSVVVFPSAAEAIRYCAAHPTETHRFYFRNIGTGPAHAMLFFTSDGGLILGLSVVADFVVTAEPGRENEWFARLKEFADSTIGFITFETPPPDTVAEFKVLVQSIEREQDLREPL